MARSTFVYVTYIRTTPEKLWSALTDDVEFMKQYWFGMSLRKPVDGRIAVEDGVRRRQHPATPARSSRQSRRGAW